MSYLAYAAGVLLVLFLGGKFRINSKIFYFALGGIVWFLFLNSGIHPTIAGVLTALCVPAKPVLATSHFIANIRNDISHFSAEEFQDCNDRPMLSKMQMNWLKSIESASDKVISPLQDLEDTLHPVVNYLIIPLFAFANAGIAFSGVDITAVFEGVSLAIIVGLVVGKFSGIFLFSWLAIKTGITPMPANTNWKALMGVSLLGGIGFTVSLFIANLSFSGGSDAAVSLLANAKLGIVVGSLIAGTLGYLTLHKVLPKKQ